MKNRYIYAELAGGLGNQIFIFEMAKYLSSITGGKIYLNNFHIDRTHSDGRSTIEDYKLSDDVIIFKHRKIFNIILSPLKKHFNLLNKLNQRLILVFDDTEVKFSRKIMSDLIINRNPKIIVIFGFWQNFSYWTNSDQYNLKVGSKKYFYLLGELIRQNPVIFHYRLSTLKDNWEKAWGELSPKFLIDSLLLLDDDLNFSEVKKNIWIFSNNLDHAEKLLAGLNISKNYDVKFIDDSELSPAEIITLFSKSQFLICSNSTFSTVAAKIGAVPNVVIPSSFSKYSYIDMSPPSKWIKVNSSWIQ